MLISPSVPVAYRRKVLAHLLIDLFMSRKRNVHEKNQNRPSTGQLPTDTPNFPHAEKSSDLPEISE